MEDEDSEEFLAELYVLENKANGVKSYEDFIEFLDLLQKEVLEDDEVDKRLQLEFFDNVQRKLNFSHRFPDYDHSIEIPLQPDWNWLARLFLVGAFEN
jgi:hypothetical protein